MGSFSSTAGMIGFAYLGDKIWEEQNLPRSNCTMTDEQSSAVDQERSVAIGQQRSGCPLDPILGFLAQKWLVHIVWLLGSEPSLRFAELQRQLSGVSAKVLSERLRQLESLAIVEREDKGTSPPHVIYRLAPYGHALHNFLLAVELQAREVPLPQLQS
jgi:DNA-binding HxlR family transcriptional regulator